MEYNTMMSWKCRIDEMASDEMAWDDETEGTCGANAVAVGYRPYGTVQFSHIDRVITYC